MALVTTTTTCYLLRCLQVVLITILVHPSINCDSTTYGNGHNLELETRSVDPTSTTPLTSTQLPSDGKISDIIISTSVVTETVITETSSQINFDGGQGESSESTSPSTRESRNLVHYHTTSPTSVLSESNDSPHLTTSVVTINVTPTSPQDGQDGVTAVTPVIMSKEVSDADSSKNIPEFNSGSQVNYTIQSFTSIPTPSSTLDSPSPSTIIATSTIKPFQAESSQVKVTQLEPSSPPSIIPLSQDTTITETLDSSNIPTSRETVIVSSSMITASSVNADQHNSAQTNPDPSKIESDSSSNYDSITGFTGKVEEKDPISSSTEAHSHATKNDISTSRPSLTSPESYTQVLTTLRPENDSSSSSSYVTSSSSPSSSSSVHPQPVYTYSESTASTSSLTTTVHSNSHSVTLEPSPSQLSSSSSVYTIKSSTTPITSSSAASTLGPDQSNYTTSNKSITGKEGKNVANSSITSSSSMNNSTTTSSSAPSSISINSSQSTTDKPMVNDPHDHSNSSANGTHSLSCGNDSLPVGEKSSEFLVRTVLLRGGSTKDSLNSTLLEERLEKVLTKAFKKLPDVTNSPNNSQHSRSQKDRRSKVKLWNIIWNNNSQSEIHVIYQVEQDDRPMLGVDVSRILTHISDQEMGDILRANVSLKAEPYVSGLIPVGPLSSAGLEINGILLPGNLGRLDWFSLSLVAFSLVVLLFCLALSAFVFTRNRRSSSRNSSESGIGAPYKSKDYGYSGAGGGRLGPKESFINWRKVSAPGGKRPDASHSSGTIDSNHEFEYLSFDTPDSSLNLPSSNSNSSSHKNVKSNRLPAHSNQARLNLAKEKVIQIGPLDATVFGDVASSTSSLVEQSSLANHGYKSHHINAPLKSSSREMSNRIGSGERVTRPSPNYHRLSSELSSGLSESGGKSPNSIIASSQRDGSSSAAPQLVQIQMNKQTESVVKAIKGELRRFHPLDPQSSRDMDSSDA